MSSLHLSLPAPPGTGGLGSGIRMAEALHGRGWDVSVTAPRSGYTASFPLQEVSTRPVMWAVLRSPLRYRADLLVRVSNTLFDVLAARGIQGADISYSYSLASRRTLEAARKRGCLTVLHAGMSHVREVAEILEKEHARLGLGRPPISGWAAAEAEREYEAADSIRAESVLGAESLESHGVPADKVHVVPASIDFSRFAVERIEGSAFRVLFVGSFSVRKGLHYLLAAWDMAHLGDSRLILFGHVTDRWSKHLVQGWRSRPGVLLGNGDSAIAYRDADVCVVPSLEDGFGLVVLEAMAAGLPVIVSDKVGAKDAVRDGIDGYVVPSCDAAAIAERLTHLRDNPAIRARMGVAARARARKYTGEAEASGLASAWAAIRKGA